MKTIAKAFAMLFFMLSLTTLTSCKKTNEQLIIGKWECVAAPVTINGETGTTPDYVGSFWTFGSDGTLTYELPESSNPNTTVSGNPATYVVNDNQLTINASRDGIHTVVYTIKELTNKKMVLEASSENDFVSVFTSIEFKRV